MASVPPSPARACGALGSAVALALGLAACNAGTPAPAGGVSKGEAQALAEAAEMLDERRQLPAEALPEIKEAPATPAR